MDLVFFQTEADEGDGESCGDHEPGPLLLRSAGISGTARFWAITASFVLQEKIGWRAGLSHPIYFGHERSIGGGNGALPCTYRQTRRMHRKSRRSLHWSAIRRALIYLSHCLAGGRSPRQSLLMPPAYRHKLPAAILASCSPRGLSCS